MKSFESSTAGSFIIPKEVARSHERVTSLVSLETDLTLPTGHIPWAMKSSKIQIKAPGFKHSEILSTWIYVEELGGTLWVSAAENYRGLWTQEAMVVDERTELYNPRLAR